MITFQNKEKHKIESNKEIKFAESDIIKSNDSAFSGNYKTKSKSKCKLSYFRIKLIHK